MQCSAVNLYCWGQGPFRVKKVGTKGKNLGTQKYICSRIKCSETTRSCCCIENSLIYDKQNVVF